MKPILTMKHLEESYCVCRLDPETPIPDWGTRGPFVSITRTEEELSIVCEQSNVPKGVVSEKGWAALKVLGPLDFALVGILANISGILSDEGISIFAISTYDTDYILMKETHVMKGITALKQANYEII